MRHYFAVIARFEPVHIRAIAMDLLPDTVSGAMHEILAVTSFLDRLARRVVHFPSMNLPFLGDGFLNKFHGIVSRLPHDAENLRVRVGHSITEVADPRDVIINAAGTSRAWPKYRATTNRPRESAAKNPLSAHSGDRRC